MCLKIKHNIQKQQLLSSSVVWLLFFVVLLNQPFTQCMCYIPWVKNKKILCKVGRWSSFQLRARKAKISDKTEDLSQNHSLKCKIDGLQSQIAKTPAEWKGDMKQRNKLQSVLVNLERVEKPSSSRLSLSKYSICSFSCAVTHAC